MTATTYLKAGRTDRVEMIRGTLTRLTLSGSGRAHEDKTFFSERRPNDLEPPPLPDFDTSAAADFVRSLPGVERFTLIRGSAAHRITDTDGTTQWCETFGRLHLSLVNQSIRVRVSIHVGAESLKDSHVAIARNVAEALSRASVAGPGSQIPGPLLLRPSVAAALWTEVALARIPCGLEQSTHEQFQRDGDGRLIEPLPLGSAAVWPNRFRPSYRSRPTRMPFHVRAAAKNRGSSAKSSASAVVTPFHIINGYVTGEVLCDDTVRTIEVPVAELDARILSVSKKAEWFPYAAGAYGSDVVIDL